MTGTHDGALELYEPSDLVFKPLPKQDAKVLAGALERGVAKAFAAANAQGQAARRDLFGLSMSYLGGCQRASAYRIAKVDADPEYVEVMSEEEARAAMIGTWIHEGLLPHLAALLAGGQHEKYVRLVVPIGPPDELGTVRLERVEGSTDCYAEANGGGVIDLKTVGAYKLGDIDAFGARERHRKQVRGYAAALVQMGHPVAWTGWLYLDRGDGVVKAVVEPFGEEEYLGVLRRVQHLVELAEDPDYAPRDERGPGLSWVCDGCPFLRRCWGEHATPGDKRAIAVHQNADIAFAGEQVVELRARALVLTKQMDFYKAQVGQAKEGQYGGVKVTRGRDGFKSDVKRMEELLEELGYQIPVVPNPGNTYIRRAPKQEGK